MFYVPDNWQHRRVRQGRPDVQDEQQGAARRSADGASHRRQQRRHDDEGADVADRALHTRRRRIRATTAARRSSCRAIPASLFSKAKADSRAARARVSERRRGVAAEPAPALGALPSGQHGQHPVRGAFREPRRGHHVLRALRCDRSTTVACSSSTAPSFQLLADSNREGKPVTADRARHRRQGHRTSVAREEFTLSFASTDVRGGLYYWKTNEPVGIMRFDFGAASGDPEPFLLDDDTRLNRARRAWAATPSRATAPRSSHRSSARGSGFQVFVNDLTRDTDATNFLTQNGDDQDRLQFASFNPKGDRIAAVYGDGNDGTSNPNTLWFLDGDTGVRLPDESFELPWEPDHPEWSPDGKMIALTRVGSHGTSQRPLNCGIEVLSKDTKGPNKGWSEPATVVPIADGVSRYNPSFVPDSSFFVYSESTCPNGDINSDRLRRGRRSDREDLGGEAESRRQTGAARARRARRRRRSRRDRPERHVPAQSRRSRAKSRRHRVRRRQAVLDHGRVGAPCRPVQRRSQNGYCGCSRSIRPRSARARTARPRRSICRSRISTRPTTSRSGRSRSSAITAATAARTAGATAASAAADTGVSSARVRRLARPIRRSDRAAP